MKIKYFTSLIIFLISFIFAKTYPLAQKPFVDSFNSLEDGFKRGVFLIVVAEQSLHDILIDETVGDFIYFKKTQGYDVEVWNYQDIGSKEQLRQDLNKFSEDNLLEYILLVGDSDLDENGEFNEQDYPIESYTITSYNDKTSPQDVTDHVFTYYEGDIETEDGLFPKCFIGRWSIEKERELRAIQRKTIRYSTMGYVMDSSYVNNALVVAGGFKLDSDSNPVYPFKWPITPIWTSHWLENRLYHYGYEKVDTAFYYLGNMNETNATIPNAWNSGVGIINYRGWGNRSGWDKPYFQNGDIDLLNPSWDLPIVFSFVCNTGDFGNSYLAFGEALIRAGNANNPKGAVAMIGPSDLDTDTRFNNVLCGALWDGLLEGRTPELGQALHEAKRAVAKEFDGITEPSANVPGYLQNIPVFYHHVYGILGDPSIPVWLKKPSDMLVLNQEGLVVEDTIYSLNSFINIKINNLLSESLEDVVGAVLHNKSIIAKGLSNSEGLLGINFSDSEIQIGDTLDLFLNKSQYFQKRIKIIILGEENNFIANQYNYTIPQINNYYNVSEIEYDWIEINPENPNYNYEGDNLYLTDDSIIKDVELGFNFTYYGYTYNAINICSNGWAAFENVNIPYFENYSIPFPLGPNAMLAAFMDDLDDNGKESFIDNNTNGTYDSGVDDFIIDCGTPENPIMPCNDYNLNGQRDAGEPFNVFKFYDKDNNRFIIQWDNVSNAEDDENCNKLAGCVKETFEIILYDPLYKNSYNQGDIIFQYKEIHDIDDGRIGSNGNLSTIGIESPDQNQGVQYLFNGKLQSGQELEQGGLDNKAIKFSANQNIESYEGSYLAINQNKYLLNYNIFHTYPNPFNPIVSIRYSISEYSNIVIDVYNIRGQKVDSVFDGYKNTGMYSINWDGSEFASGVYFISLVTGKSIVTNKVLLLK